MCCSSRWGSAAIRRCARTRSSRRTSAAPERTTARPSCGIAVGSSCGRSRAPTPSRSRRPTPGGATRGAGRARASWARATAGRTFTGALVASLSVPWGNTREERPGYHLVWPRDLVESAGALLAVGATREARNALRYLIATQNEDGHSHQNQWLGG